MDSFLPLVVVDGWPPLSTPLNTLNGFLSPFSCLFLSAFSLASFCHSTFPVVVVLVDESAAVMASFFHHCDELEDEVGVM